MLGAITIAAWALGPERGRGGVVDLAMVEVVAGCIEEFVAAGTACVDVAPPPGNELAPYCPHGVYRTTDGRWVAISVQGDDEWVALVGALAPSHDLDRPEWRSADARFADRVAIDSAVAAWASEHTAADIEAHLIERGTRVAAVATGPDLVADPHLIERDFFPVVDHPGLGTAQVVGLPWRFGDGAPIALTGPPRLGSTPLDRAFQGGT